MNDDATELYLVQHAKALTKEEDPERPLSEEGRAEMARVVKALKKRKNPLRVTAIRHSGKLRARQTAELLLDTVHTSPTLIVDEDLAPDADPEVWVRKLLSLSGGVMLVGHLPHLQTLADRLLSLFPDPRKKPPEVSLTNGAVLCLRRNDLGVWRKGWLTSP
jgi:phosphohistidine phosphatase